MEKYIESGIGSTMLGPLNYESYQTQPLGSDLKPIEPREFRPIKKNNVRKS